ncbi:hypothetical protein EJ913_12760 [Azospirillum doebereinerae]|uniref:Peptidase C58 YopT-type domain-containing protein n=2 Tax=Azospirillum doebereinerae TaxID=92933 RepID=A0A3S0WVC3_9PROT|nr:hypothetical protein EJ913_12760 [Azospirillum doebereinerae]
MRMSLTEAIAPATEWYSSYLQGTFEQADLLKTANQEFQGGVCMATCAYWIAHHRQYRSFWGKKKSSDARLEFLRSKNKFEAICRAQSSYGDIARDKSQSSSAEIYRKALGSFLGNYGLGLSKSMQTLYLGFTAGYRDKYKGRSSYVEAARVKFEDLATFLNQPHSFHIINFDGGHQHTTCCYKSNGKRGTSSHLYFFDPNRGEFKIPADDIDVFLAHLNFTFMEMGGGHSSVVALRVEASSSTKKV